MGWEISFGVLMLPLLYQDDWADDKLAIVPDMCDVLEEQAMKYRIKAGQITRILYRMAHILGSMTGNQFVESPPQLSAYN